MVGGTTHNQHPSLQLAPPSSASTTSPEEDEIVKRNTDCVYFLASPLTCKKGSECEYRHSDVARVNPRDCFYWLNGNCLNPKCAFRHPPLDGLIGADVATPVGPSKPAMHPASYATPKQGVACIFFQKGFCLKGHLCPFVHGPPNSIHNKPVTIPGPPKTVFPVSEKPVQDQKSAQTIQTEPFSARNGAVDKKVALPTPRVGPPSSNPSRSSVDHGYRVSETDRTVNAKDGDGYSREPSPGFDVLVDNEVEDSEYPREKDEFGISRRSHDYDDYDVDRVDRDTYREHRDYDHFRDREGRFDDNHVDRLERRPYSRNDRENESDLRHRISKQRRGFGSGFGSDNGLRSVVSRENHVSRHHRPDHRSDHRQDQGLSSRLRGRIKIPRRSISPGRPLSHIQTRLQDRITGYRDITSDTDSIFSGPKRHQSNDEQSLRKRKYATKTEDGSSFEGPKPLSEILKRKRGANSNDIKDQGLGFNSVSVDIEEENEKSKPADGNSVNYGNSEVEIEDASLDEELEGYEDENKDGEYEYEYEQIEGEEGEYNLDEGEFVEEDEEDGYGEKDSVVYS